MAAPCQDLSTMQTQRPPTPPKSLVSNNGEVWRGHQMWPHRTADNDSLYSSTATQSNWQLDYWSLCGSKRKSVLTVWHTATGPETQHNSWPVLHHAQRTSDNTLQNSKATKTWPSHETPRRFNYFLNFFNCPFIRENSRDVLANSPDTKGSS